MDNISMLRVKLSQDGDSRTTLSVRPAVAGDYQAILDIDRNVYEGYDPLPNTFFWMLHTSENHPFVILIGSQVVGFVNYYMLSDKKTMLGMAGRVIPQYRDHGILTKAKSAIEPLMHQKYPELTHKIGVSLLSDEKLQSLKGNLNSLCRWKFYSIENIASDLRKNLPPLTGSSRILSRSVAIRCIPEIQRLVRKHIQSYLIWSGHYFIDGAYNSPDDIHHVIMRNDIIATFDETKPVQCMQGVSFMNTRILDEDSRVGLSAGCVVFYYGESSEDCVDHLVTVIHHMVRLSPLGDKKIGLSIYVPVSVDINRIIQFLSECYKNKIRDTQLHGHVLKLTPLP